MHRYKSPILGQDLEVNMAFTPDPNLFNKSFGGGLNTGRSLLENIENRRKRSQLQELAASVQGGNTDYQNIGSTLIGLGDVRGGLAALNVPYEKEQQRLQRDFQNNQAQATSDYRKSSLGLQGRRFDQAQANADRAFDYGTDRDTVKDEQFTQTLGAKRATAEAKNNPANFKDENALRKDFQTVTKDYRGVRDAYARVNASARDPSPAGDMALIFNFMKILDPGSVVRESEFALAAASGSYGERMKAAVNQITNGEKLSDVMRQDFVSRAQGLFNERSSQYTKTEGQFRNTAKSYGMNVDRVIQDFNPAETGQAIKIHDNAGAIPDTAIELASKRDIQRSMLNKWVNINGKIFRVDVE